MNKKNSVNCLSQKRILNKDSKIKRQSTVQSHHRQVNLNDEDFVTFEQNIYFEHSNYDLTRNANSDNMFEVEDDFNRLRKKQQELEKISNELLNNQLTQSTDTEKIGKPSMKRIEKQTFSTGMYYTLLC